LGSNQERQNQNLL